MCAPKATTRRTQCSSDSGMAFQAEMTISVDKMPRKNARRTGLRFSLTVGSIVKSPCLWVGILGPTCVDVLVEPVLV